MVVASRKEYIRTFLTRIGQCYWAEDAEDIFFLTRRMGDKLVIARDGDRVAKHKGVG